ncbi:hypothetical protein BKA70DRAFT_1419014 [Coprinopsis sp. MPI-PUGE-AT-0042]|nr:hypothetical protein BKA70DRAFT_1419014 [Coprinopsis sp. MPI-PUGE-AT-0042]
MAQPFQLAPIRLPEGSEIISDGDEEIFLIYTELKGSPSIPNNGGPYHGLGYLDSSKDVLEIGFDLVPADVPTSPELDDVEQKPPLKGRKQRRKGGKQRRKGGKQRRKGGKQRSEARVADRIEIQLLQDTTSLRSRKGDTGSIVWKASVSFAGLVLQQHRFPVPDSLFDYETLKECRVVELGSGTGMLSILLSPLVKQYTVTDISELVPLIQKNVWHNFPLLKPSSPSRFASPTPTEPLSPGSNIEVRPLDWIAVHTSSPPQRQRIYPKDSDLDVVLVVDCIYHPSLIPPLLSTIDYLVSPGKTSVLVLSELRSEDVLREFISSWLGMAGWEVWHVGGNVLNDKRYVLWAGWKPLPKAT